MTLPHYHHSWQGCDVAPDALQDFTGFRVVTLLPRFRPSWPPPGAYEQPAPRKFKCAAILHALIGVLANHAVLVLAA